MARVIASIEARMGSSRLPGKVLADVAGAPALTHLVRRLRASSSLDGIVVATSTAAADDAIEDWARREGVDCFRGSEDDVLGRVVGAHTMMNSDVIVEITGDCILTDPEIIDWGVNTFLENDCDVVANCQKPGFPLGMYVQVFRSCDLSYICDSIDDPAVREHVSLYFYEHPERYRVIHLVPPKRWREPDYRLCLDYPEDLAFLKSLYQLLEPKYGELFGLEEIVRALRVNNEMLAINGHCREKAVR